MKKEILNRGLLAIFFIFSLFPNLLLAQKSLSLELKEALIDKSNLSFHNLENYSLYRVDAKAIIDLAKESNGESFTLRLEVDNEKDWEMMLEPSKVHGDDYKIVMDTGEEIEVETNITYKGYLKNDLEVEVRLTISENLIQGLIFDEDMHSFETINRTGERTNNDLIAIFKTKDAPLDSPGCGYDESVIAPNDTGEAPNQLPQIPIMDENPIYKNLKIPPVTNDKIGNTYCPKMGVTLDWQGLNVAGSVAQFNTDLQTVLNVVNGYHDNEFSVEFELTPVYVISSSPNPWIDNPCCSGEQNLYSYKDWAKDNFPYPFTCTVLFTGQNFNGVGWGMINTMCTPTAAAQIDYQYNQTQAHRGNLTTHEIGHIWGANHGGTSSQYIMSPSIYPGTLQWTSTSQNVINSKINEMSNCLPSCSAGEAGWISSTVIRGPYLQSGTPNSAILKWRTSNNIDSKVWYGTTVGTWSDSITIAGNTTEHEVLVSSLTPNTTYYYVIGESAGKMVGGDSEYYVKTAPITSTSQPVTAWILGDCGTANSNQEAVRDAYYNYIGNNHTDMVLLLGDNAYNNGTDTEYQNAIFNMYAAKLKNSMLWSCPGNHDYYAQGGLNADYYDIFTFPTAGEAGGLASNTEKYYSFDYGNIHIISLDSYDEDRNVNSPMLTWLENDLAATSQEWVVVIFHHPPYSKGSHDSDTDSKMTEMRQNVLPICENYGVDLVLSGHSHAYERSKLINGHYGLSNTYNAATNDVDGGDGQLDGDGAYQQNNSEEGTVYIVTGSAGKTSSVSTHPIMHYAVSRLGSTVLEVNGGQMDVKFLNSTGVVEDYLTLLQNGTPTVAWTNPYEGQVFTNLNTINFTADASDNDGNIVSVEFFVDNTTVGTDTSLPYGLNWTPTVYGSYVLKVQATDNEGKTSSKEINITVQDGASVDIAVQINSGDDDAEQKVSSGVMDLTSSDLELVDESGSEQEVGLRFNSVNIPPGATITNAYIQFTSDNDDTDSGSTSLSIFGQNHDNPPTFSSSTSNISNRTKTSTSINWNPSAWSSYGATGTNQQTPNISAVVQEIINRPGWVVNNSMIMIITGDGERTAESYDGISSKAATLHVSYTLNQASCDPYTDNDNDGYCSDVDCDDNNASINPDATELCDGIDNNCDGQIDEGFSNTYYADVDGDGYGDVNNTIQNNCSPPAGYVSNSTDCDDTNANIHPAATELCDGVDNNCDGQIDEGPSNTYYADVDGDGYGDINTGITTCSPPNGYILNGEDCDDSDANIHPAATELCDGVDNNCDGQIDEGPSNTYYADVDGDGYGDINTGITTCSPPNGYILNGEDCDDSDANIHPAATEICDGIDNNCDGQIDEQNCDYCTPIHVGSQNELITNVSLGSIDNTSGGWNTSIIGYSDYTNLSTQVSIGTNYSITVTSNYSWSSSKMGIWADWNQNLVFDANENIASLSGEGPWTVSFTPPAGVSLGTTRLRIRLQYGSNYTPDPCDYSYYYSGETEDYTLEIVNCTNSTFYADTDGDGFGDAGSSLQDCNAPSGYVLDNTDCDDTDVNINPAATEICDGIDNNCDGQIDEGLINTYYVDMDGDGFGDVNSSTQACSVPSGYVLNATDCDDADAAVNPNAIEVCDNIDNNCDGQVDEMTCDYCTPIHTGSENELITHVGIGDINNSSGGWNTNTIGYSDYTNLSTEIDINTNYAITVTPNYSWSGSKMGIWADWNQNFIFEANETIASLSGEGPWTVSFTPPAGATLGTIRLRIRLQYGSSYTPDPCDGSPYYSGETEDYSLEVVNCNTSTYYADSDGDGYGNSNVSTIACSLPTGFVLDNTDCDDNDANLYPSAICDDGNPLTQNDQYDINCNCTGTMNPSSTVVSVAINSGNDDVEERVSSGYMYRSSSDLEMAYDGSTQQKTGLRFNGVNVPQGATIQYAYIQFTAEATDNNTTNLNIYGENTDDAATFSSTYYDVTNRLATTNNVNWQPLAWVDNDVGVAQQTPNLSSIVQEVVNRAAWASGNSIAIVLTGTGERSAESYEGMASGAAKLFIEFSQSSAYSDNGSGQDNQLVAYDEALTPVSGNEDGELLIAIDQKKQGEIYCYPNPAENEFTVVYDTDDARKTTLEMYNFMGELVLQKPIELDESVNLIKIKVNQLPKGIYVLSINEAQSKLTTQVIIRR